MKSIYSQVKHPLLDQKPLWHWSAQLFTDNIRVYFWCWSPQWTAQADQSPPATSQSCLQLSDVTAVAQQELPLREHFSFWLIHYTMFRLLHPPEETPANKGRAVSCVCNRVTPVLFRTGLMRGWAAGHTSSKLKSKHRFQSSSILIYVWSAFLYIPYRVKKLRQ